MAILQWHWFASLFVSNNTELVRLCQWGLIKHSTIHTGERPYKCTVCDRSFRMKRGLEDHFKLHDTSLQLKCPLCPKTFVEKRHLDHHLRVHRGEKAYVCEICGDRFVNSMSLKVGEFINNPFAGLRRVIFT